MEICILNVCYCSVSKMSLTLGDPMDLQHTRASLSFTVSWNLLTLMSIESMMPSNHLILCCPLLLLPSSTFPASGSFPVSWLFTSGGQSNGPSASASVLPMNIRGWFPLGWTGLISICPRDFQESSPAPQFKASIRWHSDFFVVQLSHPYMTTGKTIAFTRWTFVSKKMPLLFNMFSRIVMAFFPRSKYLNFRAAVSIHSDSGA